MKRILLLLLLFTLLFPSCRKRVCHCNVVDSTGAVNGQSEFYVKGTRARASERCEGYSVPPASNGSQTVCEIE